MLTARWIGSSDGGAKPINSPEVHRNAINAAMAPRLDRSMPSTSNCWTMRHRPAPIDSLIAISRCRADARARSSPARFAHVINSTTAATTVRISRTGRRTAMPPSGVLSSGCTAARVSRYRFSLAQVLRRSSRMPSSSARTWSWVAPGREAANQCEPFAAADVEAVAARHHGGLGADRQPHVVAQSGRGAEKAGSGDPDDGERLRVDANLPSKHAGVAVEPAFPIRMAQHRGSRRAGLFVIRA